MKPEDNHYSDHGMREGNPGDIDSNEIGRTEPGKTISATSHLDINQSELGREQGQTPADEHIAHFSQIESDSGRQSEVADGSLPKEFDTDDVNRVDERDDSDSTKEWNAEQSRTGRNR